VPDAVLGILVAPLSLVLSVLVLAALPDVPTAAAVSGATVVLGLGVALAVRRAARQSGGVERALGFELPLWSDTGRILGWSLALLLAQGLALVAGSLLVPALRDAPVDNSGFLRDQSPLALVALTAAAVLVAPVLEELLFRGLVLRGLMLRTGFWPAAVISSVCFGALHATALGLDGVPIVLATGVFGFGLCVLTRRTGRLGPAIGVHSLRNAIAVASVALGS
jgi:membrane protease YdiL (CAAX protease family)